MPDVMFTGPEGRLEGRYHQSKEEHAPIALILHPHPQYGGTMNHKVVFSLFHVFVNLESNRKFTKRNMITRNDNFIERSLNVIGIIQRQFWKIKTLHVSS